MSDANPGFISAGYIMPSAPFVNPKTGIITPVWWRFLMSLLGRTGGVPGVPTTDVELLAYLGALTPDAPTDLPALLELTRASDSGFAQDFSTELALAMAGQAVAAADVLPTTFPDAPGDDTAALLALMRPGGAAAWADGWDWSTEAATAVAAGTYTLAGWAPFAGAITGLRAVVGPAAVGSLTETVSINGTPVTGLSAVLVNSATPQSFAATTGAFIAGDHITITVAITSLVPLGAWSTVLYTRT